MIKLQLSRHLLLLGLLACFGIACGDDSGDGPETDAGGTGGSGTGGKDAGGTGGGGTGGGGTGGKDAGGGLTKAECLATAGGKKVATNACLDCACGADPDATAQCGPDCWALLICVGQECGGKVGDLPCIASKCSAFSSGAASAMAMIASKVATQCVDACVPSTTDDGGTDDAGL